MNVRCTCYVDLFEHRVKAQMLQIHTSVCTSSKDVLWYTPLVSLATYYNKVNSSREAFVRKKGNLDTHLKRNHLLLKNTQVLEIYFITY